jgi:virulence-associated protein VagC
MSRKIFKTGNSLVVSLPKETLDYLRLQEGAEVSVELDRERRRIVIQPVQVSFDEPTVPVPGRYRGLKDSKGFRSNSLSKAGVDEDFARQVDTFIEQYRPALETLAKK